LHSYTIDHADAPPPLFVFVCSPKTEILNTENHISFYPA